jgi:hypothetical protein
MLTRHWRGNRKEKIYMIYTFLFGIDAIFRINTTLWIDTTLYFLTFVISILGWFLLKKNTSVINNCLGFIFVPSFSLFVTINSYGSFLNYFHKENFLIFGGLYLFVLVGSMIFITIKTKDNCRRNSVIQMVFIILSGLMIFTHSCIELISNFENFVGTGFVYLSILIIAYFYLKVLIVRINKDGNFKFERLNLISNILFWIHIVLIDFACFGMAAASV